MEANNLTVTLDNRTGKLKEVKSYGKVIPLTDDPLPTGMKATFRSFETRMDADTAVYIARYFGAVDSIVWRMTPDGLLGMEARALNYRTDNRFDGQMYDRPVYNLGSRSHSQKIM